MFITYAPPSSVGCGIDNCLIVLSSDDIYDAVDCTMNNAHHYYVCATHSSSTILLKIFALKQNIFTHS